MTSDLCLTKGSGALQNLALRRLRQVHSTDTGSGLVVAFVHTEAADRT